jgi:hypothetical protein
LAPPSPLSISVSIGKPAFASFANSRAKGGKFVPMKCAHASFDLTFSIKPKEAPRPKHFSFEFTGLF